MVNWIVQSNLTHENDLEIIKQACSEINVPYQGVVVIPFDDKLPDFKFDKDNIYYGSTTFMYNLYQQLNPKGLFFNENFKMNNYFEKWEEHMLSYGAIFVTIGYLKTMDSMKDNIIFNWFIRPNEDDKSFNAKVMNSAEIYKWVHNLPVIENVNLNDDTLVLVGEPFKIKKEWRNYIVDKEIVTSSLYQKNGRLSTSATDIPNDMLDFVRDRINEYTPHDNFVMDIALCGDEYYIVECGCLNSVGFYKADTNKLVKAITKWMVNN